MTKSIFKNKGSTIKLCCLGDIDYYKNNKRVSGIY